VHSRDDHAANPFEGTEAHAVQGTVMHSGYVSVHASRALKRPMSGGAANAVVHAMNYVVLEVVGRVQAIAN
jgi:hypothetical protein